MIKSLEDVLSKVAGLPAKTIAIAQAADREILEVAHEAMKRNLAKFVLVGNREDIINIIKENSCELGNIEIVDAVNEKESAIKAVELVKNGYAHMPMKGLLPTATFMRAVLDKEKGLRTNRLISQITVTDNIEGTGLNFITDCAMNILPDLDAKKKIIENAVLIANQLGYKCPKVAVLAAIETVNEAMPETVDAAVLSKMNNRGQIKNCIIDGPLALDNAISMESAKHKGIDSPVAGKADILVASDIRMGNVLHKAITYYARKQIGSVVVGTSSPLVMNSRSDSIGDKLISIALSSYAVK